MTEKTITLLTNSALEHKALGIHEEKCREYFQRYTKPIPSLNRSTQSMKNNSSTYVTATSQQQ
jgi:hypothetical protein